MMKNFKDLKNKDNLYRCNGIIHDYLISKVPLYAVDDGLFYFVKTKKLVDALDEAPFLIKLLVSTMYRL